MAVPAKNFIGSVLANVDNTNLTDSAFREFIRNSLYVVKKPDFEDTINPEIRKMIKPYYGMEDIAMGMNDDSERHEMNENDIGIPIDVDVKRIISELLGVHKISDTDMLEDDLELSDLDIVDLIMEIEEYYEIEFSDEEIDNWANITVADIIDRVKGKL